MTTTACTPMAPNEQYDPNAIIVKVVPHNQPESHEVYAVSVLDLEEVDPSLANDSCVSDDIIEVVPYHLKHNTGLTYLAHKQDLVQLGTDYITELHAALIAGDYRKASYLLAVTEDQRFAKTGTYNETALHCLAKYGLKSLFELVLRRMDDNTIIEMTEDWEPDGNNRCSVLHYIARYGHTELARSLAWIKPDLMHVLANTLNSGSPSDNRVPFQDALLAGNYELASFLLRYTDPKHTGPERASIVLTDAIREKDIRLFELLLGAEPVTCHERIISRKLGHKSMSACVSSYAQTNLHVAAQYYESAIFGVVYDAAVKASLLLHPCRYSRETFFHKLISNGNSECIIQLTKRRDFDAKLLTMPDSRGCTPFHYAAEQGLDDVCELLYSAYEDKAPLLTRTRCWSTPLSAAIKGKHASTVNFILSKPDLSLLLDIDGPDSCDMLYLAIQHSTPDICRILYERMDTHRLSGQTGTHNNSALYIATLHGKADMVDVLLEDLTKARALLSFTDGNRTVIEHAKRYPAIHAKLLQTQKLFEQDTNAAN